MFVGKRVTIDSFKDALHKCKSSTHILVRQHLDAHYRKVLSSKGAIDTSSPYAFKPSCIDQNRMYPENHHLPGSRCVTSFRKKYIFDHNLQFSNDPVVDHLVKSYFASLRSEATGNILGSFVGDKRDSPKTHNNCNTFTRPVTRSISEAKLLSGARRLEPDSYDILQIHQHKFTTQKPFSPRTIRSNASSKLRSLRCYNPPEITIKLAFQMYWETETSQMMLERKEIPNVLGSVSASEVDDQT
ncbi:unnamed protein product [Dicrocoelium dendriticum]|nr:unnamed protein product [Dicrocoelium dendriticum]